MNIIQAHLKQTPSLMDGEIMKDQPPKKYKPITEMKMEELLGIVDGQTNMKIQAGLQMIVAKIVVLIEE